MSFILVQELAGLVFLVGNIALIAIIGRLLTPPARRREPIIERCVIRSHSIRANGLRVGSLFVSPRKGTVCILGPSLGNLIQRRVSSGYVGWRKR